MKNRKLVIGLLIMAAFVVSSGTFAYWANNVNGPANVGTTGTVTIGEGKEATTSFALTGETNTGGTLVPSNQVDNSASEVATGVITITHDVAWVEDAQTSQLNGTTSTSPLTINSVVTVINVDGEDVTDIVGDLITVTANTTSTTNLTLGAAAKTFSFDITMTEPANKTEYEAIANATFTIDFTYSLGTVTTTDN